jgi:osmotically-inducible protein OsmY
MRLNLLAGLPILTLFAAGCNGSAAAYDASIDASVKVQLLTRLQTDGMYIHPETANRVVRLTGRAVSRSVKDEAVRIARTVEGVQDVADEIAIAQNF